MKQKLVCIHSFTFPKSVETSTKVSAVSSLENCKFNHLLLMWVYLLFTHAESFLVSIRNHLIGFENCGEINSRSRNSSALGLMDINFLSMLPALFSCGLIAHHTASIKYAKRFPKFILKKVDQNTPLRKTLSKVY